jgi:hypothetical protein
MIDDSHIRKFAAVYAEAVLTFLDSHEEQWLTWDGHSHAFDFGSVEMEPPPVPVMLVVDHDWNKVMGDVGESTDPESPDFDADALRNAVEEQIADEGFGQRLLRTFQERLEKIESGEPLDEDETDEDPASDRDRSDDEDQA